MHSGKAKAHQLYPTVSDTEKDINNPR